MSDKRRSAFVDGYLVQRLRGQSWEEADLHATTQPRRASREESGKNGSGREGDCTLQ